MVSNKDKNFVSTLTCVLNADGKTIINILANPVTHSLMMSDGTTGTNRGPSNALKDQNDISTLLAVSYLDGLTPVAIYADSSGNILTDSTTL